MCTDGPNILAFIMMAGIGLIFFAYCAGVARSMYKDLTGE